MRVKKIWEKCEMKSHTYNRHIVRSQSGMLEKRLSLDDELIIATYHFIMCKRWNIFVHFVRRQLSSKLHIQCIYMRQAVSILFHESWRFNRNYLISIQYYIMHRI